MNPLEAINIIEQVTGQISINREGHLKIIEAINVLKSVLRKGEEHGKNT